MSQNVQARVGVPIEHILPIKHIVPICLPEEARIGMKARCRDADWLPKVPQAGALVPAEDGGLFARQAARRYPAITSILCVEPEPGNFAALRYNLAGLAVGHARLWTTTLASQDGTAALCATAAISGLIR